MAWSRRGFVKIFPWLAAWNALPTHLQGAAVGMGEYLHAPPDPLFAQTGAKGQTYSSLGYKIYILDFQNSDLDPETLKRANPEQWGDAMVEMGIETALIYANNVFGLTFFKSQYAPKLKNVSDDFVGEWLAACRKRNIKTVLYHAVYWQEWLAQQHPDWAMLDPKGNPARFTVSTPEQPEAVVTFLCLNSPFRDYYMKQVKEIVNRYSFDSWFVDEYFFLKSMVCYNPHCVEKWRARTGKDLPRPLPDELAPEYFDFMVDTYRSFYEQIKTEARADGRQMVFTHNLGMDYKLDDYVVMETNPGGLDYYQTGVRTKLCRAHARGREVQMIPHRGNAYIDFTNSPVERLRWQAASIVGHNSAVMWADLGNVDGTIDPIAVKSVREANKVVDRLVPAVKGTIPYAEVAVLASERDFTITGYDDYLEYYGANKLLTDMHWPFDVITEEQLNHSDLAAFRLLIIPNMEYLAREHVEQILTFVDKGGDLLFSNRCAINDEKGKPHPTPQLGLVRLHEGHEPRAYVTTTFPIDDERLKASNIGTVEPSPGFRVLGTLVEPSVYRVESSPFQDSPYPGRHTDRPVIVTGARGKGNFVYVGFRFFEEYLKQDLPVFRQALMHMVAPFYQPAVRVEAPSVVEALYNQIGSELRIALVNGITGRPAAGSTFGSRSVQAFINISEVIPIHDIKIVLRGRSVRSARNLDARELSVSKAAGQTVVTVPRIDQYDLISLVLD